MCPPLLAAIPFAASVGGALGTSAAAGGLLIAGVAASGAAAGLAYMGAKQQADYNNEFQNYQYEQTQRLARENLVNQYKMVGLRQIEERAAMSQQMQVIQSETMQALGEATVRSGESGVYGNSINALMMDFRRQQAESVGNVELNYLMRDRQLQMEQVGLRSQAEANVIRAMPQYTMAPSILSPILQTAGAGFGLAGNLAGPKFLQPDSAGAPISSGVRADGPYSYTGAGSNWMRPYQRFGFSFGGGGR
jgi:hypothetical protein